MSEALQEFEAGYGFALDLFQRQGCESVAAGRGVLVAAPTGAGKTVVGEFAVFEALRRGRKCFYTTPIKALSNQKYHDLVKRYGSDRVGLLTGDTSINSEADVVVMTTEVLRNMIYAGSSTLGNLGFVVMDEVHYLADRFRGAVWEEVIIGLAPSVAVVALSATVSNAEEFGAWLDEVRGGVDIVVSETRPVPLYQHVLAAGEMYDLFAGVAPTAMALLPGERADDRRAKVNPQLLQFAKDESRDVRDDSRNPRGRSGKGVKGRDGRYGGAAASRFQQRSRHTTSRIGMVRALERARLLPAICFIFSRSGCESAVKQLLGTNLRLTNRSEQAQIDEILAQHTVGLTRDDLWALEYDTFAEGLRRGIAAHHAGMLPAFKECVEAAFVRGLVKIVFATETLALGINMPARSVVIEKLVKYNGDAHVGLTPGEYTQLTGRAGRRGIDVEGHAVVMWQPGIDPKSVAGLASTRTYPLRSSFAPTYNMAVNLVGTVGRERARALLELSFAQFQADRSVVSTNKGLALSDEEIASAWEQATCEQGNFEEYARKRHEISRLEAEAARSRKQDRRAETLAVLASVVPGDLLHVANGPHKGWVVVVRNGRTGKGDVARPLVLTQQRQVVKVGASDFDGVATVSGRIHVPRHFDLKESRSRRGLAATMDAKVAELEPAPTVDVRTEESFLADIVALRAELRQHPCHRCPDRETHARHAEVAQRAERTKAELEGRKRDRTHTIARAFDRLCGVLEHLGYLGEGGHSVTEQGSALARIYSDLDLVAAEALRRGVFDGLEPPQLAAVLSTMVYEARRDGQKQYRLPDEATESAYLQLRDVWLSVGKLEREHRVERGRDLELGFADVAYAWASGQELGQVLTECQMTAGDFVRWIRQVIDFAGQIANAAGEGEVRSVARRTVAAMRRGVVDLAPDED